MANETQTTTETDNNSKLRTISVLAIILALIFGAWYFYNKSESTDTNVAVQPTPTPTNPIVTPTPTEEPVSTKTYRNDIFTFNYPSNATLDDPEDVVRVYYMGEKQKASGRTQTMLSDGYSFQVLSLSNIYPDLKTLDEQVANDVNYMKENCPEIANTLVTKKVSLNGHEAVQFTTTCIMPSTYTYFEHNGQIYALVQGYIAFPSEDADLEMYKETTDQIYNTFKFL